MTEQRLTSIFATVITDTQKGLVLKPMLHAYLHDAKFPADFSVRFERHEMSRKPDGWFHPSTHPLWPERMLYYYVARPEMMIPEIKEYMGTLSVTIGTAIHGFVEMCLTDQGVRLGPDDLASEGWLISDRGEPYVEDLTVGSRGALDGILRAHFIPEPKWKRQAFEFKTSNDRKLSKIEDLDLEAFKRVWPDYYAQQQEYLRMSGLPVAIVLMMALGYPWQMKEFHIPYDEKFALGVRDKYLRVREAVARGEEPMICCSPRSKEARACEARACCPIGLVR